MPKLQNELLQPPAEFADSDPVESVRRICMALPEATERPFGGHDAPAFRVREKIFANIQTGHGQLSLIVKGGPGAQDILVGSDPECFFVPPYSGHIGWVGARLDIPQDWEIIEELLIDSYKLIAPKKLARSVNYVAGADDPFSGRQPTSHERQTGLPWDASYHDGAAPWDIGRPQPAIVRLASEGGFTGAVLDAGCGTGENALHVASLGLSVLGVDVAETALAIARAKANDRGINVEFAAADAFQLERLGRRFETVLDCGLFHTFDGDERSGYVASLASVAEHGGTLYVLCFSDDGPDTGPHPISQKELKAAFNPGSGWNVAAIEPDRVQTTYHDDGAPAWLATMKRI